MPGLVVQDWVACQSGKALGNHRRQAVEVLPGIGDVVQIRDIGAQLFLIVVQVLAILEVVVRSGERVGFITDQIVDEFAVAALQQEQAWRRSAFQQRLQVFFCVFREFRACHSL